MRLSSSVKIDGVTTIAICLSGAGAASDHNDGRARTVLNLDRAQVVQIRAASRALTPVRFITPDGKRGWVVKIPGGHPIATPAYADGKIFVGGGFGSHEFYAFDAASGRLIWQQHTQDDGPTAAVVANGCVAFNTESCTVVVVDEATGKVKWQKTLGDPLMSQPALSREHLYIAYPAQLPDQPGYTHVLMCADLQTGRVIWQQALRGDVISAPVVDDDMLYMSTLDGTSYCMHSFTGEKMWEKANGATSAPTMTGNQIIMTRKVDRRGRSSEGIQRLALREGTPRDRGVILEGNAPYLSRRGGGGVALSQASAAALDASVGFGADSGGADLSHVKAHLGINSVVGAWAYQGARVACMDGRLFQAQGDGITCAGVHDGRLRWRVVMRGVSISKGSQVFSPPALGRKSVYVCSGKGRLVCMDQRTGKLRFAYALGQPVVFQPILARGGVYIGTANGLIICLKSGADADGWSMWGGNAQHNKRS